MFELKAMSPEALKELIKHAEKELKDRTTVLVEEKKAKTVIAIRELLAACRSADIWNLGSIEWECKECDAEDYFDILADDVLADVAKILEDK